MSEESTMLGGGVAQGDTQGSVAGDNTANSATTSQTSGQTGSWLDSVSDEYKKDPSIAAFNNLNDFVKSYIHTKSMVGKKGVIPPSWDKAKPEDIKNFYKEIGVPEADKYEVKLPEGFQLPQESAAELKKLFSESGLLPHQASHLAVGYAKIEQEKQKQEMAQLQALDAETINTLKEEWGDKFDYNSKRVQFTINEIGKAIGEPELGKELSELGLGNNYLLVKTFEHVSKMMGEDKMREGGVSSNGAMSPDEIKSSINSILANPIYTDKSHPQHNDLVNEMGRLYKMMSGGK